jgi:hypothetical protein
MQKEIEHFQNIDTSSFPDRPSFDKKISAAIRRDAQKEKLKKILKPVGRVAKAAGIVLVTGIVVVFTMMMAIRPIRTAVWDAAVEWYNECVFISLPDETERSVTEPIY